MAMELTDRQKEYLLFFAERSGRDASISAAADIFDVAKPTVSRLVKRLEDESLIINSSYGEIELTAAGWEYIRPLLQKQRALAEWMVSGLGLLPNAADSEARKAVSVLGPQCVEACIQYWHETRQSMAETNDMSVLPRLEQGSYEIRFSLLKRGQSTKSMGDRGFRKPAGLVSDEEGCVFRLYPQQIEYKPFNLFHMYKGGVERLWYKHKDVWEEARAETDGGFRIPGTAAESYDPTAQTCLIPIRIRADIVKGRMPESEADLVFDWNSIREESI